MNIVLWILQLGLAFLYVAGGAYKVFQFDELASQMLALSRSGWRAIGVFELMGGLLLIVPPGMSRTPSLTTVAAAALAVETLTLAALYARYSVEFAVTNPMVWALAMGTAAVVVAYGRAVRAKGSRAR